MRKFSLIYIHKYFHFPLPDVVVGNFSEGSAGPFPLFSLIKFNRRLIAFSIARLSILVDSSPSMGRLPFSLSLTLCSRPGGYRIYHLPRAVLVGARKLSARENSEYFSPRPVFLLVDPTNDRREESTRKCTDANRVKFAERSLKMKI